MALTLETSDVVLWLECDGLGWTKKSAQRKFDDLSWYKNTIHDIQQNDELTVHILDEEVCEGLNIFCQNQRSRTSISSGLLSVCVEVS